MYITMSMHHISVRYGNLGSRYQLKAAFIPYIYQQVFPFSMLWYESMLQYHSSHFVLDSWRVIGFIEGMSLKYNFQISLHMVSALYL